MPSATDSKTNLEPASALFPPEISRSSIPAMPRSKKSLAPIINALAAMIVYGGWAIFANFEHGRDAWIMAGIVQGVYAFASTLSITATAKWMYLKVGGGVKGIVAGFALSFFVMLLFPLTIHNIAGTPDIFQTILPGLIWGSGYLIIFLIVTAKATNQTRNNN